MARVISADRVRVKLAALQQAEALGRARAHLYVNTRMAKQAGTILAGAYYTPAEVGLLKEAGILSRIGGGVAKMFKRAPKIKMRPQVKGPLAPSRAVGKPVDVRKLKFKQRPPGKGGPYRAQPPGRPAPAPAKPAPGRVPSRAEMGKGWGTGAKRVQEKTFGGTRTVKKAPSGAKEMGEVSAAKAKAAPTRAQLQKTEIRGGRGQKPVASQEAKKKPWISKKKMLGYGALGLTGYGLYKGVPWAARQLEQASTTPMAYGGSYGWSPVPYGYGHTPYGGGTPTMGGGG